MKWTIKEKKEVILNYPIKGDCISNKLGTTPGAVNAKARALGVKRAKDFTDEDKEILLKFYPIIGDGVALILSRLPGECRREFLLLSGSH